MRYLLSWMKFPRFLLAILLIAIGNYAFAINPSEAVEQLVQGTTVKDVSIAPAPHSNAVKLSIDTSAGQKAIILPQNQVNIALQALKNPKISGANNALVSARIINQNPKLAHYVAPSKMVRGPHVTLSGQPTKQLPTPSASAIATMSAVSANQQASR